MSIKGNAGSNLFPLAQLFSASQWIVRKVENIGYRLSVAISSKNG